MRARTLRGVFIAVPTSCSANERATTATGAGYGRDRSDRVEDREGRRSAAGLLADPLVDLDPGDAGHLHADARPDRSPGFGALFQSRVQSHFADAAVGELVASGATGASTAAGQAAFVEALSYVLTVGSVLAAVAAVVGLVGIRPADVYTAHSRGADG